MFTRRTFYIKCEADEVILEHAIVRMAGDYRHFENPIVICLGNPAVRFPGTGCVMVE